MERAYGERVPDLRVRDHLVQPPVLTSPDVTAELEAYFRLLGVRKTQRSAYATFMHAYGNCSLCDSEQTTLTDLFGTVSIDKKHTAYGAFTKERSRRAHDHSMLERRETLRMLWGLRPKLALVEVKAPPRRGRVLKAALGIRCGLVPSALRRQEDASSALSLVDGLWSELSGASLPMPIVTTSLDWLTLESVLEASTRRSFDCFLRVDRFYRFEDGSPIRLNWLHPASGDERVGFGDSLQSAGVLQAHGAFIRRFEVDGRARFIGYGPTPRGNYYAQRELPQGPTLTLSRLLDRARELDSLSVGLEDLLIERIRIAPSADKAYARVEHALAMSNAFALFTNKGATLNPEPGAWTHLYDNWDPARRFREGAL